MAPSPLFVLGTARSGSTLLARALECSPDVALGVDAGLPAFRSLRTALVRSSGLDLADDAPLEDYYFTDDRLRRLAAVQEGTLDVALAPSEWPALRDALVRRAADEAADLVPTLRELEPATYRALFDGFLAAVERARSAASARWVGLKDVWTIEFVTLLARSYPEARFVVIVRDPRGVLASIEKLGAADATQAGHALSYLRHWRKQHAFLAHYSEGDLAGRIHVVLYERLVAQPEHELRALAEFLDLTAWKPMLAAGELEGNSSFEPTKGIDVAPAQRWRSVLPPAAVALAELVCGAELSVLGYPPAPADGGAGVLDYLRETDRRPASWRSDLGDPELDHRLELERRAYVRGERDAAPQALRRAFLFDAAYRALRAHAPAAVA